MANSLILKKNQMILTELVDNYLPILDKHKEWLEKIQDTVSLHLQTCYCPELKSAMSMQIDQNSDVNQYFHKKVIELEDKMVHIHQRGMKEQIEPELLKYHRLDVEHRNYSRVQYLKNTLIEQMIPQKMARLDQLPKF